MTKDENNDYCEVCKGFGDLVCCDVCECSYHGPKCLNAKVEDLPDPWKCPKCIGTLATVTAEYKKRKKKRRKRAQGQRDAEDEDSDEDAEDQGVSLKGKPKKGKAEKGRKNRKILDSDLEMETVDEDDVITVIDDDPIDDDFMKMMTPSSERDEDELDLGPAGISRAEAAAKSQATTSQKSTIK